MRIDFYILGLHPAEPVIAALAAKALDDGERLLILEQDEARRRALSEALWQARPERFLANGLAEEPHAHRQPILLSVDSQPLNGARLICLADGQWREAEGFARLFYLVDEAALPQARRQWQRLGEEGITDRHFWKRDDEGRWREGP